MMPPDALSLEQRREPPTLPHRRFLNELIRILTFRFADDEFADLQNAISYSFRLQRVGHVGKGREVPESPCP